MSENDSDEEFCYKENAFFPRSEFFDHPTWGRVHDKAPCHTILGTDISDDSLPYIGGLPGAPPSDPGAF
jgi:hypothetical protein